MQYFKVPGRGKIGFQRQDITYCRSLYVKLSFTLQVSLAADFEQAFSVPTCFFYSIPFCFRSSFICMELVAPEYSLVEVIPPLNARA